MADYRVDVVCNGVTVTGFASTPSPIGVAPNPTREINLGTPDIITGTPSISTTLLPTGTLSTAYSVTLSVVGGAAPYTWSLASGTLPAGLSLSAAGVLSGTPTSVGSAQFTVRVTDHANQTATKAFTLTVEGLPTYNFGPRANDWVLNATTGSGGTYPDGIVRWPAGTYYWDPIDLSPGAGYARAYDPTKPNNNWLIHVEADGPGTVIFDLRPESAATHRGQTLTEAYDDVDHGGALRNIRGTTGAFRWCFNGQFKFTGGSISPGWSRSVNVSTVNGSRTVTANTGTFFGYDATSSITGPGIPSGTTIQTFTNSGRIDLSAPATATQAAVDLTIVTAAPTRLMFHGGTTHDFTIEEWRRQFDIICGRMGISVPGYTIPNTATYNNVQFNARHKGNYFPTPFRNDGFEKLTIIRADIGPAGDDGIFCGANYVDVIGTVIHEVSDKGVAPEWHHPDVLQTAGGNNIRLLDSTINGHLNIGAEQGNVTNCVFDRIWQGMCGIIGGIVYQTGGHSMPGTTFGAGAPQIAGRGLTGHFYKGFGNGTDHNDGGAQVAHQVGDNGWHAVLQDYGDSGATISTITLAAPTGVTFGAGGITGPTGFATSTLATFLNSAAVPHQQFRAAYATTELAAVMTDYGLVFD